MRQPGSPGSPDSGSPMINPSARIGRDLPAEIEGLTIVTSMSCAAALVTIPNVNAM